jgi:hypothetical protein
VVVVVDGSSVVVVVDGSSVVVVVSVSVVVVVDLPDDDLGVVVPVVEDGALVVVTGSVVVVSSRGRVVVVRSGRVGGGGPLSKGELNASRPPPANSTTPTPTTRTNAPIWPIKDIPLNELMISAMRRIAVASLSLRERASPPLFGTNEPKGRYR